MNNNDLLLKAVRILSGPLSLDKAILISVICHANQKDFMVNRDKFAQAQLLLEKAKVALAQGSSTPYPNPGLLLLEQKD